MVERSLAERYGWDRCPGKQILWDRVREREEAERRRVAADDPSSPSEAPRSRTSTRFQGPFAWIDDLDAPWLVGAVLHVMMFSAMVTLVLLPFILFSYCPSVDPNMPHS